MTERHAGYIVTLANDERADDAEDIRNAIAMISGVVSVEPIVADHQQHIATERAIGHMIRHLGNALADWRQEGTRS